MCGPEIPGEASPADRERGLIKQELALRDKESPLSRGRARLTNRITLGPSRVKVRESLRATPEEKKKRAAQEQSRGRQRKVVSGGRQSTVQAGAGIARESRRKSLLAAASTADQQRKSLLGQ